MRSIRSASLRLTTVHAIASTFAVPCCSRTGRSTITVKLVKASPLGSSRVRTCAPKRPVMSTCDAVFGADEVAMVDPFLA